MTWRGSDLFVGFTPVYCVDHMVYSKLTMPSVSGVPMQRIFQGHPMNLSDSPPVLSPANNCALEDRQA